MTTRGVRNHNPGNLERGQNWLGLATLDEMTPAQRQERRFCVFKSPEYGIRALCKVLLTYQDKHGIRTVRAAINRWAPPVENDTGSYVRAVANAVGVDPDERLDFREPLVMRELVDAIIAHENAGYVYPAATVVRGMNLAGIGASPPLDEPEADDALPQQGFWGWLLRLLGIR